MKAGNLVKAFFPEVNLSCWSPHIAYIYRLNLIPALLRMITQSKVLTKNNIYYLI